jgi:glycopeptide antibiotics resistance protein
LGKAVLVYLRSPEPPTAAGRPGAVWGLLTLAWLALVVLINWRPFTFTAEGPSPLTGLERMSWIPLAEYYWGSKYHLLDQFAGKFLAFVPLGVLAGLGLRDGHGKRADLGVLAVAAVVAFVIEIGQCYLPNRTAGLTDVLVGCLGAWAGLLGARQVRGVFLAEQTRHQLGHELPA